jgi:uncharacterized protein (TIGR00369 family)
MRDLPPGFQELPATGPFSHIVGPFHTRVAGTNYITAMHVDERHCNRAMLMHGAMMSMLFDTAFYYAARQQYEASIGIVTGHLALDFVGTAKPGDWVEAHVEIVRTGKNICYLTGFAWNDSQRIGSASAQFLTVDRTKRPLQN